MNFRFYLPLVCGLLFTVTTQAQIPGFIEKWRVNLGTTNGAGIEAIGRDGSVLAGWSDSSFLSGVSMKVWISPSGEIISNIPSAELVGMSVGPPDNGYLASFVAVLVLSSNLVVQSGVENNASSPESVMMQITQFTRSGGSPQITKTKFLAAQPGPSSSRDASLSDFSCPERLMFVQQGTTLICYRPAADITTPLTALTLNSVSQGTAELLVTSSQGGPLQLQGSTNLTNWETVTNLQTVPGLSTFELPLGKQQRLFYRGVTQ